ncbi:hypothetical protein C8R45DRAFT_940214 [Mycena sanguinolenta]|nr:hypothetical protein C8R45DRAFT_940214 [Mycena sanguinolenta]
MKEYNTTIRHLIQESSPDLRPSFTRFHAELGKLPKGPLLSSVNAPNPRRSLTTVDLAEGKQKALCNRFTLGPIPIGLLLNLPKPSAAPGSRTQALCDTHRATFYGLWIRAMGSDCGVKHNIDITSDSPKPSFGVHVLPFVCKIQDSDCDAAREPTDRTLNLPETRSQHSAPSLDPT